MWNSRIGECAFVYSTVDDIGNRPCLVFLMENGKIGP